MPPLWDSSCVLERKISVIKVCFVIPGFFPIHFITITFAGQTNVGRYIHLGISDQYTKDG